MLPGTSLLFSAFDITVDDVLCAQGADPEKIRARRPAIVETTQNAITLGLQIVQPMGWLKNLVVQSSRHNQILLEGGHKLTGELILSQLAGATAVTFAIGTLGMALERQIAVSMQEDPAFGFTLDTVGSVLAEALADQLETQIRTQAADHNQTTSLALSPGLIGWPVDEGQPQIFKVLEPDPGQITLSASSQMIPRKSISFVVGIGCPEGSGTPCDFCDLRLRCPNRKSTS